MMRKRKAEVLFQKEWTSDYLMYERNYGCQCMLCGSQFSIVRDNSLLERHFAIAHTNFNKEFPRGSKERATEILRLIEKCAQEKSPADEPKKEYVKIRKIKNTEPLGDRIVRGDNQTIAKVTEKIASILLENANSTVEDGEFLKMILIESANDLLKDGNVKTKFITTLESVPIAELQKKNEGPNVATTMSTSTSATTSKPIISIVPKPQVIDLVNCPKNVYKPIQVTKPQSSPVVLIPLPSNNKVAANPAPQPVSNEVVLIPMSKSDDIITTNAVSKPANSNFRKMADCNWYSLLLDGSKGQKICTLALYARLVYDDHYVEEKYLRTEPLLKDAKAPSILKIVLNSLQINGLPLNKLVGFTLNPCWPFCEAFIRVYTNNNNMPDVCHYLCIITEVMNCLKLMTMESVHVGIEKILTYLTHHKKKVPELHSKIVAALKACIKDSTNYYWPADQVRWLRYKSILSELVEVIRELNAERSSSKDKKLLAIKELEDPQWLLDVSFLADFVSELNTFLKGFQQNKLTIWDHITLVKELRDKIEIWILTFRNNQISTSFPRLRATILKIKQEYQGDQYAILLRDVLAEIENVIARYPDVSVFMDYSRDLFHLPKGKMDDLVKSLKSKSSVDSVELFNEIIKLSNDSKLFLVAKCGGNVWDNVKDYGKIDEIYQRLLSLFGSVYLKCSY